MLKEYGLSSLLCCLFAGLLYTTVLTTRDTMWSGQLIYVQIIVSVMGVLAAAVAMVWQRKLSVTAVDVVVAVWWLYVMLRTYVDAADYSSCRLVIEYTTLAAAYFVVRAVTMLQGRSVFVSYALSVILMLGTMYELILGLWQIYRGTSLHSLYPATGSLFNPGPYAAYIVVGMAVAIGILHDAGDDDWRRPVHASQLWLGVTVLALGCFMVVVTRSRSAVIALFLSVAWLYRREIRLRHVVVVSVVGVVVGVVLFYMKMGSALGRTVIWQQSFAVFSDSPLFGSGIGSFAGEYGKKAVAFFADSANVSQFAQYADVTDYAFCDILQVFAEQGVCGGVLCITFVLLSLRSLLRMSCSLGVALASLLVFSLFSYPLQLLPLQTLAVCLAASGQLGERGITVDRWGGACATLTGAAMAVCCYTVSKPRVAAYGEYSSIRGMTHSTFTNDYWRLLPLCGDSKQFLFDFARLLQTNDRHLDACAILRRGTCVSNDPMFWVLMGNSHKSMCEYGLAVSCYDRAFAMLPNRMYPLYRKMLLYRDTGSGVEACAVARQLTRMRPKVESAATRKMRAEAVGLLRAAGH